jgi:hypothetical protein
MGPIMIAAFRRRRQVNQPCAAFLQTSGLEVLQTDRVVVGAVQD